MTTMTGNFTVDVLVEGPASDHNRYVYDQKANQIRLSEAVYQTERYPGDWGSLPNALTADGHPLNVLLLVNLPTFAGCLVSAHIIGMAEQQTDESTECTVLAVAEADPRLAGIAHLECLAPRRVKEIEAVLYERYAEGRSTVRWRRPEEAWQFVQEARQTARRLRAAANKRSSAVPAWKTLSEVSTTPREAKETEANTAAERAVLVLPYRFQKYVEECLVPNERILSHLLRPPLSYGGLPFLRRRQAHEGLLVVTDQQMLFLTDALPPDATYVHWGYVAKAVALERVLTAEVRQAAPHIRLEMTIEATSGVESVSLDFPANLVLELEQVARILRAFAPVPNERRLRRLPNVDEDRPPWDQKAEELGPPALVEKLEDRLKKHLVEGEFILSQALAPAWPEKKRAPRLMALTKDRLLVVPEKGNDVEVCDMADISSLEIRHSLLGCCLKWAVPKNESVEWHMVDFDSPAASRFIRFFRKSRQLLVTAPAQGVEVTAGT